MTAASPDWRQTLVASLLYAGKWMLAAFLAQVASTPSVIWTLLIMMAIEIVTNYICDWSHHDIAAKKGVRLDKKALVLILLFMVHLLEKQTGAEYGFEKVLAVAYIVNEAIATVEHCNHAGVYIPPMLIRYLRRIRSINDSETKKEDAAAAANQPVE